MGAASVIGCTASCLDDGRGSNPTAALHSLQVRPVSILIAKNIIEQNHYTGTFPGGTKLAFGVFINQRLLGALTFGVGPANAHRLVQGAIRDDCLVLTRLWLSDDLPGNTASRIIAVVLRTFHRHTDLKFLVTYADPSHGHSGTIYQASNWLYIGLSVATELYDFGDGILHHSRSVGQIYGSRGKKHFGALGMQVKLVVPAAKHRYIYFLEPAWRSRLLVPVLPYPKKEGTNANS